MPQGKRRITDYDIARDRRQEQAGYPHPPASHEEAMEEERMGSNPDPWKNRYINRTPDLDQPVPQAGMADYDRQQDMENDFAQRMALKGNNRPTPKTKTLKQRMFKQR